MDRETALIIITQIFQRCNQIEGKSITIMLPNADSMLSKGCQIHINGGNDDLLYSCLIGVAEENGLTVAKKGTIMIVYKPQNK